MLVFVMFILMIIGCVRRKFLLCKSKIVDILKCVCCVYEYNVYDINLLKKRNRLIWVLICIYLYYYIVYLNESKIFREWFIVVGMCIYNSKGFVCMNFWSVFVC